jgi:hypothetical protein
MVDAESDNNGELNCFTQSVIQQVDSSFSYGSDDDIFSDPLSPSLKKTISSYTALEVRHNVQDLQHCLLKGCMSMSCS